jgi:phosphatidylglycerophosphate synthase
VQYVFTHTKEGSTIETIRASGLKKHLPNIATSIRLVGSFSLLLLMGFERDIGPFMAVPWVWLIVYIFLAFTDSIDGAMARKFNAKSDFGAFLDAFSDIVILAIGAATVFVVFASDNLTDFHVRFYVGLLIFCVVNRLSMNLYSKIFFGFANMLHSYAWKIFAAGCYIAVGIWAFLRDVPLWSVFILLALNLYGAIDEIVYCARAAKYDVNFKGHWFQKYEARKK